MSKFCCLKCGSHLQLRVQWNHQRRVPYGPNDPRTFEVILAMRSCGVCQHVWMDAKAEALLDEALAAAAKNPAGQQRTIRRGSGAFLQVTTAPEFLRRARPRAVVQTLPTAFEKPILTIPKRINAKRENNQRRLA